MTVKFKIGNLDCICASGGHRDKIAYILYPMDILSEWIETAVSKYPTSVAVITGMDWQNVFSPWPAKGVPKGTPDFKGESPQFLKSLQENIIPQIEARLDIATDAERTLVGVSMSGLFALWQWTLCNTFDNIASLSGSFWYEGFIEWFANRQFPQKRGKAFFLLGTREGSAKAFHAVVENTQMIVNRLKNDGVDVSFMNVPGNHYSNPIPRLNISFSAIYNI